MFAVLAVLAACAERLQTKGAPSLSQEAISAYCERQGFESASPTFLLCVNDIEGSELLRRKVAEVMVR